ncbi:MAG: hypothetical protein HC904_17875, partial [Blastochloris sp.]|nr:hypothetical protein [Blastochloris sp.]
VLFCYNNFLSKISLPVWVQGGVGLRTVAGYRAGGAAGVLLDWQVALARESGLSPQWKQALREMEGSETLTLAWGEGMRYRVWWRQPPMLTEVERLRLESMVEPAEREAWLREWCSWESPEEGFLPCGPDAAQARVWAREGLSVAGMVAALREGSERGITLAKKHGPLARGAVLARSLGTDYAVVQGPMTRVSDRAEFAAAVAGAGGLPFQAAALMRGEALDGLLARTGELLGERSWGVGILGFAPAELVAEQMAVLKKHQPGFVILAGGRPDQVRVLEQVGMKTFVHVASPGLLERHLDAGLGSFVLEGMECGGHTGPRSSFVLWEQAFQIVEERIRGGLDGATLEILLAGGIHDARSAAMAMASAGSLLERGVRVGVLMGSAYLFTREAVTSGAITELFQRKALDCRKTELLESGAGYFTRCAVTPFAEVFEAERKRLLLEKRSRQEVREALELLNLGRLRLASKGLQRDGEGKLEAVEEERQEREGLFMMGQAAMLRDGVVSVEELHREVCEGGTEWLERAADALEVKAAVGAEGVGLVEEECGGAVAVVGMACVFPGAEDVLGYWEQIFSRKMAVREVPASRWDVSLYYDAGEPGRVQPDKVNSRWGGFMDPIAFDPMRYGMPPKVLESVDPVQLIALEVVGAGPCGMRAMRRGASEGAEFVDFWRGEHGGFGQPLYVAQFVAGVEADVSRAGGAGFGESSAAVDGGFVCRKPGECDHGENCQSSGFAGIQFYGGCGLCFVVGLGGVGGAGVAGGTCGSGVGGRGGRVDGAAGVFIFCTNPCVVAGAGVEGFGSGGERDCVGRGSGGGGDEAVGGCAAGRGQNLCGDPRGFGGKRREGDGSDGTRYEGQVETLRRAYEEAGFGPETVDLFEMHATGTQVGDQVEAEGLRTAVAAVGGGRRIAVGSVKSMIGHTKCAAGIASLIKAVLAVERGVLPATLNVKKPLGVLREAGQPLFVNTETLPWIRETGKPRRAGVSAFGFGGTNFHVVLEEDTERVETKQGR